MDEQRKNAYRQLLYSAMLDIRICCPFHGDLSADPVVWRNQYVRSRIAGAIADWLHNLAHQASCDFAGFTEEEFWQEHADFCHLFSDGSFDVYRKRFDQYLSDAAESSQLDTVTRLRPANRKW